MEFVITIITVTIAHVVQDIQDQSNIFYLNKRQISNDFYLKSCGSMIDQCTSNPCSLNGVCVNSAN
jgi:hypothetical protein